jgi:hypothetical protein
VGKWGVNPIGFASPAAGVGGPCITIPSKVLYGNKNGKHCLGDIFDTIILSCGVLV